MNILLTGSIATDYLMVFPGYFRDHILPDRLDTISLSFLVESMTRLRGGVASNIAYTMAMLGGRPRIWATVGEDFEEYRAWLESFGVETSGVRVIPGEFTASFFVSTDRANNQIASFYPGAMAHAHTLSLYELKENPPDLVMISPNDPLAMNRYVLECQEMGIPYIYDPSQQIVRLSADELSRGIEGALALFVNDYEYALIERATCISPAKVLGGRSGRPGGFVLVTRGEKGASLFAAGKSTHIPVVPTEMIADPTGVGDAFRGGFLTGYIHNLDLPTCARMGALAATYCLEHRGPQGHRYSPEEFVRRFRTLYTDHGKLDILLGK